MNIVISLELNEEDLAKYMLMLSETVGKDPALMGLLRDTFMKIGEAAARVDKRTDEDLR